MRLKLLSPGEMNEDQKQTYDKSIAGKRGAPPPPMMAWLNSPEMARHATRLGGFLRFDTVFPAKLSEIAILVTARHWSSHYEWFAHRRLALKGGLDPKIIDDIRDRRTPQFDDPKARSSTTSPSRCMKGMALSKTLYDEAVKVVGERGVVEIIGLCGYYTMVSMTLNTFEFPCPTAMCRTWLKRPCPDRDEAHLALRRRAGTHQHNEALLLVDPGSAAHRKRAAPHPGHELGRPSPANHPPIIAGTRIGHVHPRWPTSTGRSDFIAACSALR